MAVNGSPTSSQTAPVEQVSGSEGQPEAARRPSVVSASNSTEQPQTGEAAAATADLPSNASAAAASGTVVTEKPGVVERFWALINPMTPEKLHKKLDDAWASGVLSRIRRKVIEMNAFNYNNMGKDQFNALLNEGKELLAQLNCHVQLWQEDKELLKRVHYSYVMVLSLKFLGEKASTDRSTVDSTSCHVKSAYEKSISAILRGCPPPWNFDDAYARIQAFFNSADGGASTTVSPR